ncbi:MAG: hypothetical protein R2756_05805 [Bacteroidales bacterium]
MGFLKRFSGRFNLSYEATKRLYRWCESSVFQRRAEYTTPEDKSFSPFYSVFNTVTPRDVPFLPTEAMADFPRNGTGRNPKAYADLNYQVENITSGF